MGSPIHFGERVSLTRRALLAVLPAAALGCKSPAQDRTIADPLAGLGHHPPPGKLRLGITPFSGERTKTAIDPLVRYLEKNLGLPVAPTIAEHYDDLAGLVRGGAIDLGIFSPGAYVRARGELPAVPIATATQAGSPTYLGYFVVRRDDGAQDLVRLRGKSIAWVERTSTSGYLYPRALLRSRKIDPDAFFSQTRMAGDHDKALDLLIAGAVDVATVSNNLLDRPRPRHASHVPLLRVIAKTRRIPLDCLVVHQSVDRTFAARLRGILFELVRHPDVSEELAADWGIHGFVPLTKDRYDEIADVLRAEGS